MENTQPRSRLWSKNGSRIRNDQYQVHRFKEKTSPTDNNCIPIKMVCIDDVRSFMEIQTKKNLSGVSWNDLKKHLYLDSFKIDKFLNPCVVFAWYEKVFYDEISERKRRDLYAYTFGLTLMPFCSRKSIVCYERHLHLG